MKKLLSLIFLILTTSLLTLQAQTGIITLCAGNAIAGYSGDGTQATNAEINTSADGAGVAVDNLGNIYIADSQNNRIRMVNTNGNISTIAGTGVRGYNRDGQATATELDDPICVRVDNSGNIYFSDAGNEIVRKITAGVITTIAGIAGTPNYTGNGGPATAAELSFPAGIALDQNSNVYIADEHNNRIRELTVSSGLLTTIAGNGTAGAPAFGAALNCPLNNPTGIAVANSGAIYIADRESNEVLLLSSGIISQFAGNGSPNLNLPTGIATLVNVGSPTGVCVNAAGNVFISDGNNNVIWEVITSLNQIYLIAGLDVTGGANPGFSGDGGPATAAEFYYPFDVATDANNNVYIADQVNNCVRKITNGCPTYSATVAIASSIECYGNADGQVAVSLNSLFAPYTYSWSPSGKTTQTLTGLSAGTYTVTITDAAGCSASNSIALTQPPQLGISILSVNNVACNGGTGNITANTATGGTLPYAYRWTPGGGANLTTAALSAGTYTITVTDNHGCTASASATITQPTGMAVSATSTSNENCSGGSTGSAMVTTTGGTSPYTYSWTPGGGSSSIATGLTAGTYTIHVTSYSGCAATAAVTITQPTPTGVLANASGNVSCYGGNNGSATATPSGGTSPYTYSWAASGGSNQTATGLTAGTYTVHLTSYTGCTSTASVAISQPAAALGISLLSITNINCYGGTGNITANAATGGTSPYNYSWSSGGGTRLTASGLSAGIYTLTATDNHGCAVTVSATITQPASSLGIAILSVTNINCYGGTGSVTANNATGGTPPYTYNWTSGGGSFLSVSGLSAGAYTITATDNHGCTATASVTITQPASAFGITISSVSAINCYGGTGNAIANAATGGTSPYTYSWTTGGGTALTATGLSASTYTITATDNHGCTVTASATITQPELLGIGILSVNNVNCNTIGSIVANAATGGSPPYTYNWTPSGGTNSTASGLSAGTYSITITDNHGCTSIASATITQPANSLGISISTFTNASCFGGTGAITANTATGGTSPYTYNWTPGGGTSLSISGLSAGTYYITVTNNTGCTAIASATITAPASPPFVSISFITNVSCYGGIGSATANAASGGTSPYTYNWTPSGGTNLTASGLSAGVYTLTVTDYNGCNASISATITQPASALGIAISAVTDVSCNVQGSATANAATGGTSPYTYNWTPRGGTGLSVSGLSAGTYTITATDNNGCIISASVTVTQPANSVGITISTFANAICFGGTGSATANVATGGTSPYTYNWTSGGGTNLTAVNLSAGIYSITVTDNVGCTASSSVTISQPAELMADIAVTSNVSCNGNSNGIATVSASGGTGAYTYSWSPLGGNLATATGLAAGTFTVTVTDNNGCSVTALTDITQPGALTVTHDSVAETSGCNGIAVVIPGGGTSPYTYLWTTGGQTTDSITSQCSGTYCCTITDNNGCSLSTCVTVNLATGIENISNSTALNIYPNPNSGQFTIDGLIQGQTIEVYNYLGQRISSIMADNTSLHFTIYDLPNGMYLIRIIDRDGKLVIDKKILKLR